jgi:hypothetical protein
MDAAGLNVLDEFFSAGSLGEWQLAGDAVVPILLNDLGDEGVGDRPSAEGLLLNLNGYAAGVVFAGSPVECRRGTRRFLMESSAGSPHCPCLLNVPAIASFSTVRGQPKTGKTSSRIIVYLLLVRAESLC